MTKCPLRNRRPGSRVVRKLNSRSFQWCTLNTRSWLRLLMAVTIPALALSTKWDILMSLFDCSDMRYSLRQLEVFLAVARTGSVSRAGDELAMSQSAVSSSLAELERQFDVRLFDRLGKRLRLSEM